MTTPPPSTPLTPRDLPPPPPLRSAVAHEPDMAEVVAIFVAGMPQRVGAMVACWEAQTLEQLRRLAYQLRGASSGYGFPAVGEGARRLEDSLEALARNTGKSSTQALRDAFEELVALCRRVSL